MRGRVGGARRRAELDEERARRMSAELTATNAKGASAELVRVAYFGLSAGAALAGAGIRVRCVCL
jgi:hypothetical protein